MLAKGVATRCAAAQSKSLFTAAPARPAVPVRRSVRMASSSEKPANLDANTPDSVWKTILNAEQYHVLREKGTEYPGTGKWNKHFDEGVYTCAGCDQPLYTSKAKFDSGCGWPAFYEEIPGSLTKHVDNSWGVRIEICCSRCGGHQGHVFEGEGFPTPTDVRHCVNSASINFKPIKI